MLFSHRPLCFLQCVRLRVVARLEATDVAQQFVQHRLAPAALLLLANGLQKARVTLLQRVDLIALGPRRGTDLHSVLVVRRDQ